MNLRLHYHTVRAIFGFVVVATLLAAAPAYADHHEALIRPLLESHIKAWLSDPLVANAIKEQNAKHASLTQAEIDRLDEQWRAETKMAARPLIKKLLSAPLSRYLKQIKSEGQGLYTEIFVMDNKGLNVGQSDVTSDYWQGDEAKWTKTFLVGPGAVFIDEVEEDESSQQFQSQVSLSIVDPTTNIAIGALTVGINVEALQW